MGNTEGGDCTISNLKAEIGRLNKELNEAFDKLAHRREDPDFNPRLSPEPEPNSMKAQPLLKSRDCRILIRSHLAEKNSGIKKANRILTRTQSFLNLIPI